MTREDLINLGFKEIHHFTIGGNLLYDLGRRRYLSLSCFATPNEMLFISELDDVNDKEITDLICLWNYDYDGYLTEERIKNIINALTK